MVAVLRQTAPRDDSDVDVSYPLDQPPASTRARDQENGVVFAFYFSARPHGPLIREREHRQHNRARGDAARPCARGCS